MTKAEAVDVIFLNVNGGKASADAAVKRHEIEAYFGEALESAIKGQLYEVKNSAKSDKGSGLLFEDAIPESFYTTLEFTPEKDSSRGVWTATLPKVVSIENGWGVRHPRPKANPVKDYIRLPHAGVASAMPAAFRGAQMYWTEEDDESTYLYMDGVSTPVCTHLVSIIKNPKFQDGGDELNAPKDAVNNAILQSTQYFMNQARYPASERLDDKAPNEGE